MKLKSFLAGLAILFVSSAAQAGAPSVTKSFIFEGSDCIIDCVEGASAFLVVDTFDFEPLNGSGTDLSESFIVDFGFSSDSGVFDGFDFFFGFGSGVLFGTPDEVAEISIFGVATIDGSFLNDVFETTIVDEPIFIDFAFNTSLDGTWSMEITEGEFNLAGTDDVGLTHAFNPVPEPGALALLGIGLIGLAAVRRRRQAA